MHLLECMFILEHCIALRWRVAHLGQFHYLALAHPVEGYILQVQGACEGTARPRDRGLEESRVVALMYTYMY